MNQGFPTAVTYAIDSVLGEILRKHNEPTDMPMGANAPNTYVTGTLWAPEQGSKTGACGGLTPNDAWANALNPEENDRPMPGLTEESDDEDMDFTETASKRSKVRSTRPPRAGGMRVEDNVTGTSSQWLTEEQCMARLRDSGVDWSAPLQACQAQRGSRSQHIAR